MEYELCTKHEHFERLLEEVRANTVKIIQALYGPIGETHGGIVAQIQNHETRLSVMELARDRNNGRIWDVFLKALPWLAALAMAAALGWHTMQHKGSPL